MLSIISKYRTELMGYTMLFVLLGHIITLGGLSNTDLGTAILFIKSFLPVTGFLFLSGFGMMFSLKKNDNWNEFYKRRFYRFLLPFWCLSIPYFIIVTLFKDESIWYFFSTITTVEFWISGNYHGMWYIAVSLLLYVITPILYSLIKKSNNYKWVVLILFVLISVIISYILESLFPHYWKFVGIGVSRIPYFFLGMVFGYFAQCGFSNKFVCFSLNVVCIAYVILRFYGYNTESFFMGAIMLMMGITVISTIVSITSKIHVTFSAVNRPLRWMGKYSYELYMLHLYLWFIIKNALKLSQWQNIALACILAIVFAYPVHLMIEKICNKIQKLLSK
ncbi:MAG: acyltransferase [Bacteroidaceae bacterium]|nr:acyltransferase [Bacteroidaceae bacterium]